MPTFTSIGAMKNYILKTFDVALAQESSNIEQIFQRYLDMFYNGDSFFPTWYERTSMLMKSFMMYDIIHTGNGAYVEGDFDGHWNTGNWDDETILHVNLTGSHGGVASGTDIWGEGVSDLRQTVFDDMKSFLRGAGLPVV